MSVIHQASLVPGKLELLDAWLAVQPWAAGEGELERIGTYRFDDPEGEVGIEGFILARGTSVFHVVLTYRGAPVKGADRYLIGTMEHSVLGTRWVYDGLGDPVAVAALIRATNGGQGQAVLELWDGGNLVGTRDPDVRVESTVPLGERGSSDPEKANLPLPELLADGAISEVVLDGITLRVVRVVGAVPTGGRRLIGTWPGGHAVLAATSQTVSGTDNSA